MLPLLGPMIVITLLLYLPQAEVDKLESPILHQANVVWLQVAVAHDTPRNGAVVEVLQSVAQSKRKVENLQLIRSTCTAHVHV